MNLKGNNNNNNKHAEVSKPKSVFKTTKRLLKYMKKSSILIILTIIIAIAGTIMQVMTPKLLGNATTIIFDSIKNQAGLDMGAFQNALLIILVMYLGVFIASFLQERIMTVVSLKTTESLRNSLKEKFKNLPISFFDKHSTGDLMSIASNDVDNISSNLQQSLTQLISSSILIVGSIVMMLTISPLLTLLALVIVPVSMLLTKYMSPIVQKYNKTYLKSLGKMNGNIEQSYQNFLVVKSFNQEGNVLEEFKETNNDIYRSGWLARFFGSSMMHLMMLVQNINYVLIAVIGAFSVINGTIVIGNMQAFLQYSQQFSSPIARLSQIWAGLLSVIASAERIFTLLDADEMKEYNHVFDNINTKAKVSFNNVKFGYDSNLLMKNFNLNVNEGEKIAIVGHTGAGKTTLVNLLERFYEINDGSISINNVDVRNMDYTELRDKIGMVLQDTWLFSGTIYDNIKYGNENATKEDVYAAAKASFADDFIQKLPQGYDTVLDEDAGNISQGQKQLITIARALVANPDIIILDEATSNVDSRTEMVIQKAMQELLKGRTSFVIAHRLSTIYNADKIIVMEDGDIVEVGNHEELKDNNGVYAGIYNSQFNYA